MRKKVLGIMALLLITGMLLTSCATPEDEYNRAKDQVQRAVLGYQLEQGGTVPIPPHGVMINTSGCSVYIGTIPEGEFINAGYVLDLCYLLEYTSGWEHSDYYDDNGRRFIPLELPICCYGQSGQEATNFYTGNCTNPFQGHYIWLVDDFGNVCSVCGGDDCWANNESGYQGVWP
jgi:hypothetical protein